MLRDNLNLFGGMAAFLWHHRFFFFFFIFFHKSGVMCFVSNHSITFNIKSLCHEVLNAVEAYIFSDVLLQDAQKLFEANPAAQIMCRQFIQGICSIKPLPVTQTFRFRHQLRVTHPFFICLRLYINLKLDPIVQVQKLNCFKNPRKGNNKL